VGTQRAGWVRQVTKGGSRVKHTEHGFAPQERKHEFLVSTVSATTLQPPPQARAQAGEPGVGTQRAGWDRQVTKGGSRVNTQNTVHTAGAETRVPGFNRLGNPGHHPGPGPRQESLGGT